MKLTLLGICRWLSVHRFQVPFQLAFFAVHCKLVLGPILPDPGSFGTHGWGVKSKGSRHQKGD